MTEVKKAFILGNATPEDPALKTTKQLYDEVGQNTGNLAFHEGIRRILGSNPRTVNWGEEPKRIDSVGDIGVIAGANQFGAHVDYANLADRFSQLECGLVMLGLGAQSSIDGKMPMVPEGTVRWVKEIASRSPSGGANITVRGPFTKSVLDHYGLGKHAIVAGCPSLFINPDPELGAKIEARQGKVRRVAVAAGHQSWAHLKDLEASLVKIARDTNGSYVGQHALAMIMLTRGEASELAESELIACRDYACPDMDIDQFINWMDVHGHVFFDIPSWMEHYRQFDLVVGARIHGVMLALQAGVPGLCIAHDSRTLELCQTMGIPHAKPSELGHTFDLRKLGELAKLDGGSFDRNRAELAKKYRFLLNENDLLSGKTLKILSGAG